MGYLVFLYKAAQVMQCMYRSKRDHKLMLAEVNADVRAAGGDTSWASKRIVHLSADELEDTLKRYVAHVGGPEVTEAGFRRYLLRYYVADRAISFVDEPLVRLTAATNRNIGRLLTRFLREEASLQGLASENEIEMRAGELDAGDE